MLAVPGMWMADYFGKASWETAGALADSPLSTPVLLAIELIVWGGLEYKRYEIYKKTG